MARTNIFQTLADIASEHSNADQIQRGLLTLFKELQERPAGKKAVQTISHDILKNYVLSLEGVSKRAASVPVGDGRRGPRGPLNKDGTPRKKPGRKPRALIEQEQAAQKAAPAVSEPKTETIKEAPKATSVPAGAALKKGSPKKVVKKATPAPEHATTE